MKLNAASRADASELNTQLRELLIGARAAYVAYVGHVLIGFEHVERTARGQPMQMIALEILTDDVFIGARSAGGPESGSGASIAQNGDADPKLMCEMTRLVMSTQTIEEVDLSDDTLVLHWADTSLKVGNKVGGYYETWAFREIEGRTPLAPGDRVVTCMDGEFWSRVPRATT